MPLNLIAQRSCENSFESEVINQLIGYPSLNGVVVNNFIIPNERHRELPNEHDVLVLLDGIVYTLDAKALDPGDYRDAESGNGWSYRPPGTTEWGTCTFPGPHPTDVALKKARVVEDYLKQRMKSIPQVVSAIIVPDNANLREVRRGPNGTTPTGARLFLWQVSELCAALERDYQAGNQRNPRVEDLRRAFAIEPRRTEHSLPYPLTDRIQVEAFVDRYVYPIPREEYRGTREISKGRRRESVRIEFFPKYNRTEDVRRLAAAFDRNVDFLLSIRHPANLQVHWNHESPVSRILVTEWFSDRDLSQLVLERPLELAEVKTVFLPVVDLLTRAHQQNIVHRYLDPWCFLIQQEKGKATDVRLRGFFGAAVGDLSTVGRTREGIPFVAPEFTDPRSAADRRSPALDHFALGHCLNFALTGSPFDLPSGPSALCEAIKQLLDDSPANRKKGWDRLPQVLR